jgi:hypothetical protein
MARRFKVEGTKAFLHWSIGLLILGLWCIKDGWFPSQTKIDEKTAAELASFVLFNKSLAYICIPASAICAYIHRIVR